MMQPLVAQIAGTTTFEVMTGLALTRFAEQVSNGRCWRWACGRLDATTSSCRP